MTREDVLERARECVCGQREQDYGTPEDNFAVIGRYWETYLRGQCVGKGTDICVTGDDVAVMMALFKIGRLTTRTICENEDTWVDLAGYAACGAEIATGGGDEE